MSTARVTKLYLSLCVCIQLLKIIKFTNFLIPKMGLATAVLHKGMADLFFFGLVFGITMLAFCMMFYVQAPHPPVTRPLRARYITMLAFCMMFYVQARHPRPSRDRHVTVT